MTDGPYTLQFEELSDGWCRARVVEHPDVIAEAATRPEAREMAVLALMGLLSANAPQNRPVPSGPPRAA